MLQLDGARFTINQLTATLDEVASVEFNEAYIQYKGLAMIFQPFLGGEVASLAVTLKDGRSGSVRLRGPQDTALARQIAIAASLAAGAHDIARLQAGETVDYGPVKVSSAGVKVGRKQLGWDEIGGYRVTQGALLFDKRQTLAASVWLRKVKNPFALLNLLDARLPGKDYARMEPGRVPSGSVFSPTAAWHDPRYPTGRMRLMILAAPLVLLPFYCLAGIPFAIMHHGNVSDAMAQNQTILAEVEPHYPSADAPLSTPLQGACPSDPIAPDELLAFVNLDGRSRYAEASSDYVFSERVPRPWPTSIVDSYSRVLFEAPTDWGRLADSTRPYRNWRTRRVFLVATELSYTPDTEYTSDVIGRTSLNVRLVRGGSAVCEGHVDAELLNGPLASHDNGTPRAVVAAMCPAVGPELCAELSRFVRVR